MLKILVLSVILLFIAVIGLSIKLLFNKKAEFTGGSCCKSTSSETNESSAGCACRGGYQLLNEK